MEDAVLIQLSHVSKHFFHQEGIVPVLHNFYMQRKKFTNFRKEKQPNGAEELAEKRESNAKRYFAKLSLFAI